MTTATTMAANKTPTTEPAMLPPETSIGGSRTAIHPFKKEKQKMNKQTEKNSHTVDFDENWKEIKRIHFCATILPEFSSPKLEIERFEEEGKSSYFSILKVTKTKTYEQSSTDLAYQTLHNLILYTCICLFE